jgi:DNA-binding NarL/FixJ family response regulator
MDRESSHSQHVQRHEEGTMRSFWEQTGVLGPIYRLLGRGLNNADIAARLNITQEKVEGCVAWLLHFLTLKNRQDLVLYASKGK